VTCLYPDVRNSKILVIEDDHDVSILISTVLEAAGYQIVTARDADTAFRVAHRERPDLITLDMGMPGGGGGLVLDQLRADPVTMTVPVVVVTGSDLIDKELLLEQGAQGYVQKPFEPADLLARVREQLR
jgi:DNA-binding response OmpR family regulator